MGLNTRMEAIGELQKAVKNDGVIQVSKSERLEALSNLADSKENNILARKRALLLDYPRFFRVAMFGSARLSPDSEEFLFVMNLSKAIVEATGADIVTGGGPSLMEAANLGAKLAIQEDQEGRLAKVKSIAELITSLAGQKEPNTSLDRALDSKHTDFPSRLQGFVDRTHSSYSGPGGFGSLLEIATVVQMAQVGHLEDTYKIVLHPFWESVMCSVIDQTYTRRNELGLTPLIEEKDTKLFVFSNNIPIIVDHISQSHAVWYKNFGQYVQRIP